MDLLECPDLELLITALCQGHLSVTESAPRTRKIEPTSIEVRAFSVGVASKSQAVPYRLDDTIRLMTLSERH
jgi:hypothetical protein